jgi:hypothetical protein
MIDALIAGRIHRKPSPFSVTRKRRAALAAASSPASIELPSDDDLPGAA